MESLLVEEPRQSDTFWPKTVVRHALSYHAQPIIHPGDRSMRRTNSVEKKPFGPSEKRVGAHYRRYISQTRVASQYNTYHTVAHASDTPLNDLAVTEYRSGSVGSSIRQTRASFYPGTCTGIPMLFRCFSPEGDSLGDISITFRTAPTCLGKTLLG